MVQYMRRNAERQANMFVVAVSTPAQLFHALRRQMNRPFLKCADLLQDMTSQGCDRASALGFVHLECSMALYGWVLAMRMPKSLWSELPVEGFVITVPSRAHAHCRGLPIA